LSSRIATDLCRTEELQLAGGFAETNRLVVALLVVADDLGIVVHRGTVGARPAAVA
jgi:hypothetical protein